MEPHRILLYAEDDPASLRLVQRLVALRPDLTLVSASDGTVALGLARRCRPDLIILDLNLPDMDGSHVIGALRKDAATSAIPVVVLTADASPSAHRRAMKAGADDVMTKPIEVGTLLAVIEQTISGTTPGRAA